MASRFSNYQAAEKKSVIEQNSLIPESVEEELALGANHFLGGSRKSSIHPVASHSPLKIQYDKGGNAIKRTLVGSPEIMQRVKSHLTLKQTDAKLL